MPGQRGPGKAPGRVRRTYYFDLEDCALIARVRHIDDLACEAEVVRLAVKHYGALRIAEHAARNLGSLHRCGCGLMMEPAGVGTDAPNASPLICPRCDADNG